MPVDFGGLQAELAPVYELVELDEALDAHIKGREGVDLELDALSKEIKGRVPGEILIGAAHDITWEEVSRFRSRMEELGVALDQ